MYIPKCQGRRTDQLKKIAYQFTYILYIYMYGTCITDIIYSYFDVSEMRLSQYVLQSYCKFTKGLQISTFLYKSEKPIVGTKQHK